MDYISKSIQIYSITNTHYRVINPLPPVLALGGPLGEYWHAATGINTSLNNSAMYDFLSCNTRSYIKLSENYANLLTRKWGSASKAFSGKRPKRGRNKSAEMEKVLYSAYSATYCVEGVCIEQWIYGMCHSIVSAIA